MTDAAQVRQGILFGLIAYTCWGLVPLYFHALKCVSAPEILAHRIVWALLLMTILTTLFGGWARIRAVFHSRNLTLILLLSAILLAGNWLLYIYATVTQRVTEASLGYYMMPLVNAFLGTIFLKEKLRPAHYPALALVAVGVLVPILWEGHFTWLALALPITFGTYGLVRKMVSVDSATGLTVEAILLLIPSLGYLLYLGNKGEGAFGHIGKDGLLMFSGVVTVVPLLTYTLSIRRLPLLGQIFIQFLSPTVQMLLGVYVLNETVSTGTWVAIVCVWIAVLIFVVDAYVKYRNRKIAILPKPVLSVTR